MLTNILTAANIMRDNWIQFGILHAGGEAGINPSFKQGDSNAGFIDHVGEFSRSAQSRRGYQQRRNIMFDILQLALIVAVAAAILGSALAYAWRDANRDPRLSRGGPDQD